jgi:hypothetical protein
MPTSAKRIFALAVASTSAYDVFAPSLSVNVTADDRGGRGSTTTLDTCAGVLFGVFSDVVASAVPGLFLLLLGFTTFPVPTLLLSRGLGWD